MNAKQVGAMVVLLLFAVATRRNKDEPIFIVYRESRTVAAQKVFNKSSKLLPVALLCRLDVKHARIRHHKSTQLKYIEPAFHDHSLRHRIWHVFSAANAQQLNITEKVLRLFQPTWLPWQRGERRVQPPPARRSAADDVGVYERPEVRVCLQCGAAVEAEGLPQCLGACESIPPPAQLAGFGELRAWEIAADVGEETVGEAVQSRRGVGLGSLAGRIAGVGHARRRREVSRGGVGDVTWRWRGFVRFVRFRIFGEMYEEYAERRAAQNVGRVP